MPVTRRESLLALGQLAVVGASARAQEKPSLLGHWPLAADGTDASGNGWHAKAEGVVFDGKAATFDGRGGHLAVALKQPLDARDFTLSLRAHADDHGDLVSWYDPAKRVGLHLSVRTNTGVTSSAANARQLQFGIDAGTEPTWADEGRPGTAVLGFAMAAHAGNLYVGTADNAAGGVGKVYRYDGPNRWADCGAPDTCNVVSAMAAHRGKLYAASAKYRFAGSALPESPNTERGGGVFRYDGGTKWTEVGRLPDTEAVGGLVVFREKLHASSLYRPAGFFRMEADGKWTALPVPDGKRVESLGVFDGSLWATSYDGGRVYRWDGEAWKDFGNLGENTQTYSFAAYRGRLHVGTWPSGRVYRLAKDDTWEDVGRLGGELEVMGMCVHGGQLYAGSLPLAEVYRYDGGTTWTKLTQLDRTPDVKYRRAWTMAQHRGRLFCTTLPSGRVHSMTAGVCVTHDHEFPTGWRHVAAVRGGGMLRLYLDGRPVAESAKFDPAKFDLTTGASLLIGAGAADFFRGSMRDVQLYAGALSEAEIRKLSTG